MNKWILWGSLLLLLLPSGDGTEAKELLPVELLQVYRMNGEVVVQTDTGESGTGEDVWAACADLDRTTPGKVFLETTAYLLITDNAWDQLKEITQMLRPATKVCRIEGSTDGAEAAAYLSAHDPQRTLRDLKKGRKEMMLLIQEGERYRLEKTE